MAHRDPLTVVLAAWPGHRVHVGVHQRTEHLQTRADRERQQTLTKIINDLGHRTLAASGTAMPIAVAVEFSIW